MNNPQVPVARPYFDDNELERLRETLASGWVAQGPAVRLFEERVAECEGVGQGVAVSSGTAALHLALAGMGLGPGEDVLVPSFTFVATANAVEYLGARPVFIDVDPASFCLDPEKLRGLLAQNYRLEKGRLVSRDGRRPLWGLIAVHLFGLCADMEAVGALATEYGLKVLEDSACALGSSINGVHQGAFGYPACLSFHARKTITCGEGGMILTDDEALAERLRQLRNHGASARPGQRGFLMADYDQIGFNYRLTDLQAALGLAQMDKLDWILERKKALARRYDQLLEPLRGVIIPRSPEAYEHTYQSYVIRLDSGSLGLDPAEVGGFRNQLMAFLEEARVGARQGTHAVHLLGYYARKYHYELGQLPGAEICDRASVSLSLYAAMSEPEQDYVVETLAGALDK